MTRQRRIVLAVAATLAVVITAAAAILLTRALPGGGVGTAAPSTDPGVAPEPAPRGDLTSLTDAFFDDWVDDDGRVVRRDQGDDTVSEGQAYGLLLAVASGDEARFDTVWQWTSDELLRPDGLLAWRWVEGEVVDAEPAADADLDAARALVLAGDAFGRDDLRAAGVGLGTRVLDDLTATTDAGRILLPGTWAADGAAPYDYNPSYASPAAYAVLGEATGDPRWDELAAGSAAATDAILAEAPLPPDWALVQQDGAVDPMPGAQGSGDSVRYSYDAARLAVRYAESCDPADRERAARLAPTLTRDADLAMALDLGGSPLSDDRHPLGNVARAGATAAAGETADAVEDLRTAVELDATTPTYYGAAWVALGTAMLATDSLGGCSLLDEGVLS